MKKLLTAGSIFVLGPSLFQGVALANDEAESKGHIYFEGGDLTIVEPIEPPPSGEEPTEIGQIAVMDFWFPTTGIADFFRDGGFHRHATNEVRVVVNDMRGAADGWELTVR